MAVDGSCQGMSIDLASKSSFGEGKPSRSLREKTLFNSWTSHASSRLTSADFSTFVEYHPTTGQRMSTSSKTRWPTPWNGSLGISVKVHNDVAGSSAQLMASSAFFSCSSSTGRVLSHRSYAIQWLSDCCQIAVRSLSLLCRANGRWTMTRLVQEPGST